MGCGAHPRSQECERDSKSSELDAKVLIELPDPHVVNSVHQAEVTVVFADERRLGQREIRYTSP